MLLFMDCSGIQGSEGAARPMLPSGQPANAVVLEPQPLLSKPGSQQVECKACSCLSILTRQKASWPYLSAPMIRKRKTWVVKIVHLCLPKSPAGQVCGCPGLEATAVAGTTCHLWSAAETTTTKHGLHPAQAQQGEQEPPGPGLRLDGELFFAPQAVTSMEPDWRDREVYKAMLSASSAQIPSA